MPLLVLMILWFRDHFPEMCVQYLCPPCRGSGTEMVERGLDYCGCEIPSYCLTAVFDVKVGVCVMPNLLAFCKARPEPFTRL